MSSYDEDNYTPEIYYIPGNVADNGNVMGGMLKLRNLIEAIVLGLLMFVLWRIFFYPFGLVIKTIAFGVMVLPAVAFSLVGIQGESLVEWFFEFFYFQKKKRMMIFEIPRPEAIKKKRFGKKEKNTDSKQTTSSEIDEANMSPQDLKKLKKEQRKQARIDAKRMEREAKEAKKAEKAERKNKGKKDKYPDVKGSVKPGKNKKGKNNRRPVSGNMR